MFYVFEMCDIVFVKTEILESRQIESQDCLKFANFIVWHVDFKVFLGKIRKIWELDDFLDHFWNSQTILLDLDDFMLGSKCSKSQDSCSYCVVEEKSDP
jgi:hypothetical protein